jgi:co-chaperonin GroES (HSP10)
MNDLLIAQTTNPDTATVLPGSSEEKARQVPDPTTFYLLGIVPESNDTFESGLVKADTTRHYEEVLTPVLFVAKMGPDAFKDPTRFPNGAPCQVGDFILVRPNSGTRLKIHGREFRVVQDIAVEAVVQDPRGIQRAS